MAKSILFFAPSAFPLGGVAVWLDYLLPGLADLGWTVRLGLTSGAWHDVPAYTRDHPFPEVVTLHNPTGSREGRVREMARVLREAEPDLAIGVNLPDLYFAVRRLRHAGVTRTRLAMSIHAIQPDLYEDARAARDVLDAVVCTNRLACKMASEFAQIEDRRIFYAPYGVKTGLDVASVPTRRLRIGYAGRFEEWQKRVSDLSAIVDRMAADNIDFSLTLAGTGPAEASLRSNLARHQTVGRVNFLGPVSAGDLAAQLYREIDVLLVTSLWETGPLVIWEALANGVAVVSSSYVGSGLEGALRSGRNCLLFPVGDIREAVSCLAKMADSGYRQELAHAGRQTVEQKYTEPISIQAWNSVLNAVLESDSPALQRESASRPVPSGRLGRVLGESVAETVRRALGRSYPHSEPGGEWPHTYGESHLDDQAFWRLAEKLDSAEAQTDDFS